MSVDTIIAIVGFGLSVGGFVPLLLFKDRRREIAVVTVLTIVCVYTAWKLYASYQYDLEVKYVRTTLLDELANGDMSYDDMRLRVNDVDPAVFADTIRIMTRSREITANAVQLHDQNGQTFKVYLYRVARISSPR